MIPGLHEWYDVARLIVDRYTKNRDLPCTDQAITATETSFHAVVELGRPPTSLPPETIAVRMVATNTIVSSGDEALLEDALIGNVYECGVGFDYKPAPRS